MLRRSLCRRHKATPDIKGVATMPRSALYGFTVAESWWERERERERASARRGCEWRERRREERCDETNAVHGAISVICWIMLCKNSRQTNFRNCCNNALLESVCFFVCLSCVCNFMVHFLFIVKLYSSLFLIVYHVFGE